MSSQKNIMRYTLNLMVLLLLLVSCKKEKDNSFTVCSPDAITIRQILNNQAIIKVTGTIYGVYLLEQSTIDTKLIPCNLPIEFVQDNLQVVISGDVKFRPHIVNEPCCIENLVITKISR
jgi:hypothetical protein